MQHYIDVVQDRSGNVIGGAIVVITDNSTGLPVTVYSDAGGSVVQPTVTTDVNGTFSFYVGQGRYNFLVTKNGVILKTVNDVDIPGDYAAAMTLADAQAGVNTTTQTISASILNASSQYGAFTPTGTISATSIKNALGELDTEKTSIVSLSASTGSTLVGTTNGGTGAVTRTVASKLNDTVSVKDFGATGNNSTDDTAAIQAAINSGAYVINFPAGIYKISAAININASIIINGSGTTATQIVTYNATANMFNINTAYSVEFNDLKLVTAVTQTAGAFINGPSAVINSFTKLNRCHFASCFNGFNAVNMGAFQINDCYFAGYRSNAIIVSCPLSPDYGVSTITSSVFDGTTNVCTAILQNSSGGLRVLNNYFIGGAYHYVGSFDTPAQATSDLIILGNIFENASTTVISFITSGALSFSKIIIESNIINLGDSSTGISMVDSGVVWLTMVVIGGNHFELANSCIGMNITRVNRASILTNSFFNQGTLNTGITFQAGATNVIVYPQDFFNVATPYAGTLTGVTFTANTGTFTTLTSSSDAVLNGVTVGKGGGAVSTNTAIGNLALNATASGGSNTAIGRQTLLACLSGSNNVAVGNNSLQSLTTGSWNVGLGVTAFQFLTTGNSCTGVGFNANLFNVSGNNNVAVGYNSLLNSGKVQTAGVFVSGVSYTIQSIGSTDFTLIGASANTVGVVFTASGIGTGTGTASPNNGGNIALGYNSGGAITTGSNNVVIGSYNGAAAPISATGSNYIVLSDGAANVRQIIDPNGHAIFGATTRTAGYLVTALPTGVTGMRAYVTNALTPVWGATVVTGGAVTVPVFYNGSNWIVG